MTALRRGTVPMNKTDVKCPACGAPDAMSLWRVDSAAAAQHFVLRESDPERHAQLAQRIC